MVSETLPYSGSNHFPILLTVIMANPPKRNPFKVEQMWFKNPNLIDLLEQWWTSFVVEGSKIYKKAQKPKFMKINLIQWNKYHFGNIF